MLDLQQQLQRKMLEKRISFRTIPIHPIKEGRCGCGNSSCENAGKHPISWSREAEEHEPYGVLTGRGVAVLDLDLKGRKIEEVIDLVESNFGALPDTLAVETGSGGVHLYFSCDTPTKNATDILGSKSGVDWRGDGGMVIGPGSPHRSGEVYEIVSDVPLAPAPVAIVERLRKKTHIMGQEKAKGDRVALPEGSEQETKAKEYFVKRITEEMPPSISGQGGDMALWNVCVQATSLALRPELSAQLIGEHFNPRCQPPWDHKTIERKVFQAWEHSEAARVDPDTLDYVKQLRARIVDEETPEVARFDLPEFPRTRRTADPNHTYTFDPRSGLVSDTPPKSIELHTLLYVLSHHPEWDGVWQWDRRNEALVCVDPPLELDVEQGKGLTKRDRVAIGAWFIAQGAKLTSTQDLEGVIHEVAREHEFDPLVDYLDALPVMELEQAHKVVGMLATEYLNPLAEPVENDFVKKFLIASVNRAYEPGCKADTMLVLYGDQGAGKSTFGRVLYGEENFLEQMPERLSGRDASHMLFGRWCVEFAELEQLLRVDEREVKSFLTRQIDEYRAFGTGVRIRAPRQTVFLGTTNEQDFLRDPTGNRRFWPVHVTLKIDRDKLREQRDAIWSAAKSLYRAGVQHFYEDEKGKELEAIREQYIREDEWTETIREYCMGRDRVRGLDVFVQAIARGDAAALLKFDRKQQVRIAGVLKAIGCTKCSFRKEGVMVKGFWVPDHLRALAASEKFPPPDEWQVTKGMELDA